MITPILGIASGTVLTVAANIPTLDYEKTIVLAAVGATVSFFVSVALKWVWKRVKR
jgi:uncharacterized membrane protein (UPF0136 family)